MVLKPLCARHSEAFCSCHRGFSVILNLFQDLSLTEKHRQPFSDKKRRTATPGITKLLRVMKLTAFFLFIVAIQVSATGNTQGITLSQQNAPIAEVFKLIKQQSGVTFYYNVELLQQAKKVTIQVKNASLEEVLELCFKNQPFSYELVGKTVVIKPRVAKSSSHPELVSGSFPQPPIDIKGRITNEDGEPVAASVLVKGTQQGTTSNADGYFEIKGVDENATLVVSGISIENLEVKVNGKTNFELTAKIKVSSLNEVIVNKGYYTEKQKTSTGNVFSVKAKDIERQPVSNPLLALQGRVPGLFITQSSGLPGSGVTVRIQGQNSIGKGNDPLYVIDGVPYTSQLLSTINNIQGSSGGILVNNVASGSGNPFSFINPSDIESIDVLKDADATAIYGSRAANGAILITTKKGKQGRTTVNVNVQNGWGKVTRLADLMNTQQYLQLRREGLKNENVGVSTSDYDVNGLWDTTRYTNWQNKLIGGTAKFDDYQISVSGGNSNTQILVGANYHKETTVFPGNLNDQKGSIHFNISNLSSDKKFSLLLSGIYLVDNNLLQSQDLTNVALRLAPNAPELYNNDGSLNWALNSSGVSTWMNPLAHQYLKYRNKTNNLIGNVAINYKVLPGLDIKTNAGYTSLESNEFQAATLLNKPPEERPTATRSAGYANSTINTWIIEQQLNYEKKIGKSSLNALLGTTIQQNNNYRQYLSASGFNSDLVLEDIKSASTVTVTSTINSIYKYNALFARINYNWQDKYIVNLTARRDGSSRFGSENLFHNFGSIAGAWIFSKENFISRIFPFISFGKLRISYGTTGNDQIGDYQFMNLYGTPTPVGVPYGGGTGLQPNGLPNPFLKWEETRKLQASLDLSFFADRILFNANYFHNRSSNELLAYSLPFVTGFSSIPTFNFPATVQNTGLELFLSTTNFKTKNFNWTSSINLTCPKNKLISFPNLATSTYSNDLIIGRPITRQRTYHYLGVDPATGLYIVADKNGNPTPSPNALTDKTVLINTAPVYYGGLQNNIRYKAFELDFLFQFVKQQGSNYFIGALPGQNFVNQPISVTQRWQKPGDISSIQRFSAFTTIGPVNAFSAASSSDVTWTDASYIRLKNLAVSWQLPELWRKKIHLQNCKLYLQGQNLLTITKYPGLDPENKSTSSLPPLRVITAGIQIIL